MTSQKTTGAMSDSCWNAGIVNHGDYQELHDCLDSLLKQTQRAERIRVYDTGVDPAALETLQTRFPEVEFELGPNRGYAGGGNRLIDRLTRGQDAVDFILLVNADIVLDPEFGERLLKATRTRPEVALAGGKLFRPGREVLDSTGVVFPRNRRPRDRGSEQVDLGQYQVSEYVEGVSGAALWLRCGALESLSLDGEIFDEAFFAYHEDTDLCWRARSLGWSIWYEATATAVHRRGWRRQERMRIPVEIRRHSFKNHYLQLAKNERGVDFVRNLPWLLGWEVLRLGFVALRDPGLFPGYPAALSLLPGALRKRRLLSRKRPREALDSGPTTPRKIS